MVNQGMILGRSSFVYRVEGSNTFVTFERRKEQRTQRLHVDIALVRNDILDTRLKGEFENLTKLFFENKMFFI